MTLDELKAIYEEYDGEIDDHPELECVKEGDWISDGKYDLRRDIFSHEGGQFFEILQSRTGSYFTDYFYTDPEFHEVAQREVKKIVYSRI